MKNKYNKLSTVVESMEARIRETENTMGQTLVKLDIVIANQATSNSIFENHDKREMKKYELQDGYLMEVNNTLKDVINKLDSLALSQSSTVTVMNKTNVRVDTLEEKTNARVTELEKKQSKFINYGTATVVFIGILWTAGTWTASYMRDQQAKVRILEDRELKRYAEIEALKLIITKDN
tara:strand:- start:1452 stop:1988 length:537 start_codon:yes stop_codon:yes gene_type:complete